MVPKDKPPSVIDLKPHLEKKKQANKGNHKTHDKLKQLEDLMIRLNKKGQAELDDKQQDFKDAWGRHKKASFKEHVLYYSNIFIWLSLLAIWITLSIMENLQP